MSRQGIEKLLFIDERKGLRPFSALGLKELQEVCMHTVLRLRINTEHISCNYHLKNSHIFDKSFGNISTETQDAVLKNYQTVKFMQSEE